MKKNNYACLLVHGYLGTPEELYPLRAPLEDLGLVVEFVTLPGHDSTLAEFRKTSYKDWEAAVEEAYLRLAAEYAGVLLGGFSLGGALSLGVAERHAPLGVITMAAPVFATRAWPLQLKDWALLCTPFLRFFVKELPHRPGRPESRAIVPWKGYDGMVHPPQLYSLLKGFRRVRRALHKISAPLLIMHDLHDRTVHPYNAAAIAARSSSFEVRVVYTKMREKVTSHHLLPAHPESRVIVAREVRAFAARVCGLPPPTPWMEPPDQPTA